MSEKKYEAYEEYEKYEDYTLTNESQEEVQGIREEQEAKGDQEFRLGQEEDLNWEEDLEQDEQLMEEDELNQEDNLNKEGNLAQDVDISQEEYLIQEECLSQQETLDEEELAKEKVFVSGIIEQDTKNFQYQENTSFRNYTRKSKEEGTKGFKKWFIRLIKLVVFLMCLPFLGLLLVGIVGAGGTIIGGGIASVGLGICLLVVSAFFSSYLGGSLIALGIMLSITFTAAGILILLLCFLGIRSVIRGSRYYREKRKKNVVVEGER